MRKSKLPAWMMDVPVPPNDPSLLEADCQERLALLIVGVVEPVLRTDLLVDPPEKKRVRTFPQAPQREELVGWFFLSEPDLFNVIEPA